MDTLNISNETLKNLTVYNKGGYEGKILLYNENMLFKHFEPYLKGFIDLDLKKAKIERFITKHYSSKILTAPHIPVNVDNEFSGFLMEKIPDAVTIDNIKNYRLLLDMYVKLFRKLEYLHRENIIINDLKRSNIIVSSDDNPIFVDVDSMGIDELKPDNISIIPSEAKNIPNIEEKKYLNSPKEFDKLLLLSCFLISLSDDNTKNIKHKVLKSNLSKETKDLFLEYISTNYLDININFSDILNNERKK